MTSKWSGYFKIVTPQPDRVKMTDSQEMADVGAYNNYTWYQRLVQGSASRMTRYREYDLMDNDVEVARALDTIGEEMTGNGPQEPLLVDILNEDEDNVESNAVLTLKTALRKWTEIHDWENRLFKVSRTMIKYGDIFFRRIADHEKWVYIHPKNVVAAVVDEHNVNKVQAWQIKKDIKKPKAGGYGGMPIGAKQDTQWETELVDAKDIIRFTLNDDMSDTAPFGESLLRTVYRAHKQKELLEDAIIIYRVQRAPERRVFYIDVGKMPPQRVKQYLETIKNEIKQKKIPNINGGQFEVDSVYNPQSMSEDFFFAARPDGRGSKVDTLPGGQGLGELSDLEYFQRKVWRGLRVPASYMIEQQEGGQIWNDGKVGVAYIQELRFMLFVQRQQGHVEQVIDTEFKKYLRACNIRIDESMYRIRLPEPSNFGKYRKLELDSQLLNTLTSADGVSYFSKRFIMDYFMQMPKEDQVTNERLKREELGLDPDGGKEDFPKIYGMPEEGGGMGGGLGLDGGFGGEELGMEGKPEPGTSAGGGAPTGGGGANTTAPKPGAPA